MDLVHVPVFSTSMFFGKKPRDCCPTILYITKTQTTQSLNTYSHNPQFIFSGIYSLFF